MIAHINGLVGVLDSVRTGHATEEQAHGDLVFGLRVLDGVIHEFTSSVHALLA